MKIGNLVRHKTFDYYGVIIATNLHISNHVQYVEIHWAQGDLSPIWNTEHICLEVVSEMQ